MSGNRRIVALLICAAAIVCAGIVVSIWNGVASLGPFRLLYYADTNVEETVEETFAVGAWSPVDIVNECGDVVVRGDGGDEVRVVARISLWGEDEEDARRTVDLQMGEQDGRVTVRAESIRIPHVFGESRSPAVTLEVHVPHETRLYVQSRGDVSASGMSGILELDALGDITVSDAFGSLGLRSAFSGRITVTDSGGTISVGSTSLQYGIDIQHNTSGYREYSSYGPPRATGDVELLRLTDAVHVMVGTASSVTLRDVEGGTVEVRGGGGRVYVERATLSGALYLQAASGGVTAIDITAASCRLVDYSGDVTLAGCAGAPLTVVAGGRVEVRDANGVSLDVSGREGVHFSGSLDPAGSNYVVSDVGDVTLILPADAAFDLEATALAGAIESEFVLPRPAYNQTAVSATVNGGGPLLMVYASSRDILLQKLAVEGE